MALNIGDNFSYLGAKPLDNRRVFANKAAMDAVNLSTVYEGMIAYAKAEDKYYRLKNGVWIEFKAGSGIDTWKTNTSYSVGDIVINDDSLYRCNTAHISTSTFDDTKWTKLSGDTSIELWETNKAYKVGDLVIYNSVFHRCNTNHTSTSFNSDYANWDDINSYLASWKNNMYYSVGNIVENDGEIYKCKTSHVSGSSFDTDKWTIVGGNGSPITNWKTAVEYLIGDVVLYDGIIFLCIADHTSTTFTADIDNWTPNNVVYDWQSNTVYFKGQVVSHNGIAYTVGVTFESGATFSDTNLIPIKTLLSKDANNILQYKNDGLFGDDPESLTSAEVSKLINDFNPSGSAIISIDDWEQNHVYALKDIVIYNSSIYRCTTAHTSSTTFDSTKWEEIGSSGGMSIGDWATGTAYKVDDWVRHENILYKCITAHTSSTFTSDKANWEAITAEEMEGATSLAKGKGGIVPEPQAGDNTKYLRGDGTWNSPSLTELAIKTDILWEGGSTSQVQGDILTLNYTYTDYDRIACYVGTSDGVGDACWFSPSKENHVYISPATQGTDVFGAYMEFSGSTATFKFLVKGTTNTNYLKRIEGVKFTTTAGNVQDMTGATQTTVGTHGLVPAPQANSMNKFLAGDGTWKIPGNSLSVVRDLLWEGVAYTPNVNLSLNHVCTDYDYVVILFGGVWNSVNLNIGQTVIDPNKELWAYVSGQEVEANTSPSNHAASILFTSNTATIKAAYGLGGNWHIKRIEGIKFVNPNVYLPTEQRIGTWVDGSPLYQKTIIATNVVCSAGGGSTKIGNIGSFTNIVGFEGIQSSDGLQYIPLDGCWTGASGTSTLTASNSWHGWLSVEGNGDVMLGQSLNLTVAKCYVTIKYTK